MIATNVANVTVVIVIVTNQMKNTKIIIAAMGMRRVVVEIMTNIAIIVTIMDIMSMRVTKHFNAYLLFL